MIKQPQHRGAVMVESAIALLALLICIFGVIDLGRAYNVYQVMTNAVREGARYSIAPADGTSILPNQPSVQQKVVDYLATGGINATPTDINVTYPVVTIGGTPTTFTHIEYTKPYTLLFFPFASVSITAVSEMRNENN